MLLTGSQSWKKSVVLCWAFLVLKTTPFKTDFTIYFCCFLALFIYLLADLFFLFLLQLLGGLPVSKAQTIIAVTKGGMQLLHSTQIFSLRLSVWSQPFLFLSWELCTRRPSACCNSLRICCRGWRWACHSGLFQKQCREKQTGVQGEFLDTYLHIPL